MAPRVTCECGTCRKCKCREYMRTWYAKNAERARQTARESRVRRIEAARAYDRERGFRSYDPAKTAARRALNHAVSMGRIARGPCEVCGDAAEAHHEDYSRPLEVRWLCRTHHAVVHRRF